MTHTPGPWTNGIETGRPKSYYVEHVKIGKTVCYMSPGVGMSHQEMQANAHLIAAAPDLLEALKEILEGNTMKGKEQFTHADVIQRHYQIARNAIAKAEGRTK